MKKLILLAALLGTVAAFAEDSYLYWMVGDGAPSNYAYARVRDTTTTREDPYLTIYDEYMNEVGGSVAIEKIADASSNGEAFYASLAGIDTASSTWIIELYNEQNTKIDESSPQYYTSIYTPPTSVALQPQFGQSYATPEPSSGMLVLVGCAMLGLRRRRLKAD